MSRFFTAAELAYICDRYPTTDTAALAADVGRKEASVRDLARRYGWQKAPEYISSIRSRAGTLRRNPVYPKRCDKPSLKPDGTRVLRHCKKRPHWYIKVGGKWVREARHRWETEVGPIPRGWLLWVKTADTANPDPANWECISPVDRCQRITNRPKAAATTKELRSVVRRVVSDGKPHRLAHVYARDLLPKRAA